MTDFPRLSSAGLRGARQIAREQGVKVINPDDRNACTMLIADIQALENRAHRLGMTITGHALNNAKNAAGWELAGETELAGKASRGERA